MELSLRLQSVVNLLDPHTRIADIGCDHGFVSIYLVESKKAVECLAMDINKGPLNSARENIDVHGLKHHIELRLSDGAKAIEWKKDRQEKKVLEVQAAVMAGIGGRLTVRILEQSLPKFSAMEEFILQPQSEIDKVRIFLEENHFSIVKEDMVFEDGKYYPVMKVKPLIEKRDTLSSMEETQKSCSETNESGSREIFYMYGEYLLKMAHPVLYEYLLKEQRMYRDILMHLEVGQTEKVLHRKQQVKRQLEFIEEGLGWFSNEM